MRLLTDEQRKSLQEVIDDYRKLINNPELPDEVRTLVKYGFAMQIAMALAVMAIDDISQRIDNL